MLARLMSRLLPRFQFVATPGIRGGYLYEASIDVWGPVLTCVDTRSWDITQLRAVERSSKQPSHSMESVALLFANGERLTFMLDQQVAATLEENLPKRETNMHAPSCLPCTHTRLYVIPFFLFMLLLTLFSQMVGSDQYGTIMPIVLLGLHIAWAVLAARLLFQGGKALMLMRRHGWRVLLKRVGDATSR